MKYSKIMIFAVSVFTIFILTGCQNKTVITEGKTNTGVVEADEVKEVKEVEVVEKVDEMKEGLDNLFELNLFLDKTEYKTTDKIKIWATLKYIGENNKIKIWHGNPYISFYISDGKDFNTGGAVEDILISTELEKEKIYHFNYSKSGGFTSEDPKAEFWKKFYGEKDLYLPKGEYSIKVSTAFSLTDNMKENIDISKELKIVVKSN